jgi:protein-S-isoprenylcysteine O-methyltransferase Ste14
MSTSAPLRNISDDRFVEAVLRALAVFTYGLLITGVYRGWRLQPDRWSLLALLVIETFTLGLLVFARQARSRDLSPAAVLATSLATFYFVFLDFGPTRRVTSESVALTLQGLGALWQVWAKWTLGRSFGMLPAQRGVVTGGPHRVVRHPIYLGYLVSHVGFLLANFSPRNAAVLAALYLLQAARMRLEERVLMASSTEYAAYTRAVRWRFVPGVF